MPTRYFLLLLILPAVALAKLTTRYNWQLLAVYLVTLSLITVLLYWHDKHRARGKGWRTPESSLHTLELLGGWPAAFFAQTWLRHKTSKRRFQRTYWSIVALHHYLSAEILLNWQIAHSVFGLFR
ncbi:MAG: DUF1294 domain-containing protein [Coraliomargarita sp.]